MRAFADQISAGLQNLGHRVERLQHPCLFHDSCLVPILLLSGLAISISLIFPPLLWLRIIFLPKGTLCVLSDRLLLGCLGWVVVHM